MPYTIGLDRDNGQVVPSECSTQFQEARWAHLRALHHRGNRGGGEVAEALKGQAFPLNAIADDQCHLCYRPEFGLHKDLHTQHGHSGVSQAERRAEEAGHVAAFNLNAHIPKWVIDLPGVRAHWNEYEKLFLTDFESGEQYHVDPAAVGGVVGCTAEREEHRRPGAVHRHRVIANRHTLPAAPSVKTWCTKTVRLVIEPPQSSQSRAGEVVSNGAVALVHRTAVTEQVGDENAELVEREPVETIKPVKKALLQQMVRKYRENSMDEEAAALAPGSMVVYDASDPSRSLRHEVWRWYGEEGMLSNSELRAIFTTEALGAEWRWEAPPDCAVQAERSTQPQPSAEGWHSVWDRVWGWIYSNGNGGVSLVDPGRDSSGQEGEVVRTEGSGARAAPGVDVDMDTRARFVSPGSSHRVPVDMDEAIGDV